VRYTSIICCLLIIVACKYEQGGKDRDEQISQGTTEVNSINDPFDPSYLVELPTREIAELILIDSIKPLDNQAAGLFTSDAKMFLPNRPPLIGREAIGEWFEVYRNKVTQITETYVQQEINIVGDIALVRSRGTGNYIIKSTQEQFPLRNKFVDVIIRRNKISGHHL